MSFSDMINQLGKKKEELRQEDDAPQNAATPPSPDNEPRKRLDTDALEDRGIEEDTLDDAIHLFETIREIVGDDEDFLRIPLRALTSRLPENMRGPEWDPGSIPEGNLHLEIQPLLKKLRTGKVSYPSSELIADLPEGWVIAEPDDELELDLATVFSAVPPELIEISSRISESMEQILDMPDYFSAKSDEAEPEEPGSEQAESAAEETAPANDIETESSDRPADVCEDDLSTIEEGASETDDLASAETAEVENVEPDAAAAPAEMPEPGTPTEEIDEGEAEDLISEGVAEGARMEAEQADMPDDLPAEEAEIEDRIFPQEAAVTEDYSSSESEQPEREQGLDDLERAAVTGAESQEVDESEQGVKPVLKPARHEPAHVDAWSGRESVNASVSPTDLNTASPRELELLPGLGKSKASAIIRYRELHGELESIYDLLSIPGIGARNFEAMTGLDPDKREDRSLKMKQMLGLADSGRPRLSSIAKAIVGKFNAEACILSGADGIIISQSGSIEADEARQYAALAPKIFRGTKKYLAHLEGLHPHMVALPGSNPPILFVGLQHLFMALALKRQENLSSIVSDVGALAEELDWFFSNRAIVGK